MPFLHARQPVTGCDLIWLLQTYSGWCCTTMQDEQLTACSDNMSWSIAALKFCMHISQGNLYNITAAQAAAQPDCRVPADFADLYSPSRQQKLACPELC